MLSASHRNPIRRRFITGVALLSTAGLLIGCTTSAAQPDVTDQGRLAFGCSLAEHVEEEHGNPETWSDLIGDNAEPGVREVATIGNLLVAAAGAGLDEDHPLPGQAQNLLISVSRADTEVMATGLEEVRVECDDLDMATTVDVSHEGQLEYACALAGHLDEEYGSASQWMNMPDSPAVYLAAAAASVTGAYNGHTLAEQPQLFEAGVNVLRGISVLDAAATDEALAELRAECSSR